jgi:cytoskeletal protein CcmA (bactofilin family)
MAKNHDEDLKNLNIISNGTSIIGNIVSNGDIRIDGSLEGNVETKAKLVLGETGKIKGEIICATSEISGLIEGKISVEDILALKSTAQIIGDIQTTKISIEPGAVFTGTCNMCTNIQDKENI